MTQFCVLPVYLIYVREARFRWNLETRHSCSVFNANMDSSDCSYVRMCVVNGLMVVISSIFLPSIPRRLTRGRPPPGFDALHSPMSCCVCKTILCFGNQTKYCTAAATRVHTRWLLSEAQHRRRRQINRRAQHCALLRQQPCAHLYRKPHRKHYVVPAYRGCECVCAVVLFFFRCFEYTATTCSRYPIRRDTRTTFFLRVHFGFVGFFLLLLRC